MLSILQHYTSINQHGNTGASSCFDLCWTRFHNQRHFQSAYQSPASSCRPVGLAYEQDYSEMSSLSCDEQVSDWNAVNRVLRRHNKAVYSSLSIRHVAEQIEKLYWDAGAPTLDAHDVWDDDDALKEGDDLCLDECVPLRTLNVEHPRLTSGNGRNISKLSEDWGDENNNSIGPADIEKYAGSRTLVSSILEPMFHHH